MAFIKKNQLAIYVIALMLVVAGYFNYSSGNESVETSSNTLVGEIGDATLVSSNDVVSNSTTNSNSNESMQNSSTSKVSTTNTNGNTISTNSTVNTNSTSVSTSDYFSKTKLERESMYSQMLETYDNVLNSSNALETQKQSASEEITKINNIKNGIMISENLLETKGFKNSVILVNGESVNVIIQADTLDKDQIAQIQNIVERELNTDTSNIHIATKQ